MFIIRNPPLLKGKYHFAFKHAFKEANRVAVTERSRRRKIDHSAFFQALHAAALLGI